MKYRVHKLNVEKDTAQETLEQFLNTLSGEVISVLPYSVPRFYPYGATAKIAFLMVVEKKG